jgi:hypothetical protein
LSLFDLADGFSWIVIKEEGVVNKYLHDYRAVLGVNDFRQRVGPEFGGLVGAL